jgi:xylulose-5-phosphate/fructose-6-phosphate phosphoketolase
VYQFDATITSAVRAECVPPPAAHMTDTRPLSADLLDRMQRYWQAANYLTIGQIYLQDNPLLRETLRADQIKRCYSATGDLTWAELPGKSKMVQGAT